MGTWHVEFSPRAYRQFSKLSPEARRRIAPLIDQLTDDPRTQACVALAGTQDLYRLRAGPYRIVYSVVDDRLVVLVVRVGHRRDVYRER